MIVPLRARPLPVRSSDLAAAVPREEPNRPAGPAPLATRTVDHGAIARNVGRLLEASRRPLMAVVKADAFGHGAPEVARTALDAGASWLGVATVDEALALREAGIGAPVFAWLVDPWCDLAAAVDGNVTLSCANLETLMAIERVAAAAGRPADIHLELDTGMARGGAAPATWDDLCFVAARLERSGSIRVTGVWSHLALAARPGPTAIAEAIEAFTAGIAAASAAGLSPTQLHLANSAAALAHPEAGFTMVRAGAAVYGIETVEGHTFDLEPALRFTSRVTQLRTVPAGTGVGYLHRYRTRTDAVLALVPVGYGDGVPRALSGGGWVSIDGRPCAVRGTVSMDQLVVEVDTTVGLGAEVVLLGSARDNEPTVQDWAELADTIPHDILSGLGGRIALTHISTNKGTASA